MNLTAYPMETHAVRIVKDHAITLISARRGSYCMDQKEADRTSSLIISRIMAEIRKKKPNRHVRTISPEF